VVHHAIQAVGRSRRRDPRLAIALTCCTVALLAGCGDDGGAGKQRSDDFIAASAVGSVRTANCTDWKKGAVDQRRATVVQLRKFAGGPVGSSELKRGPVLEDKRAYKVLQSYCKHRLARGFKLYKLYERAAAFVGR
jgi:hypothetical protein